MNVKEVFVCNNESILEVIDDPYHCDECSCGACGIYPVQMSLKNINCDLCFNIGESADENIESHKIIRAFLNKIAKLPRSIQIKLVNADRSSRCDKHGHDPILHFSDALIGKRVSCERCEQWWTEQKSISQFVWQYS